MNNLESLELQFKQQKLSDEEIADIYEEKYRDNFRYFNRNGKQMLMRKNKDGLLEEISMKEFEATIQAMFKCNGIRYGSILRVKKAAKYCLYFTGSSIPPREEWLDKGDYPTAKEIDAEIPNAKKIMKKVLKKHPLLSPYGYTLNGGYGKEYTQDDFFDKKNCCARQFILCRKWLEKCQSRKTVNNRHTSYGYKHFVEEYYGYYIYNGVFILAALSLGISYRTYPGHPNVTFGLSESSLKVLISEGEWRHTKEEYHFGLK